MALAVGNEEVRRIGTKLHVASADREPHYASFSHVNNFNLFFTCID